MAITVPIEMETPMLQHLTLLNVLTSCLALTALYTVALVVYRLYFSPLTKFPGPKLVAATGWVEFYWDVIIGGRYLFEIEKMHDKYGQYLHTPRFWF